MGELAEKAEKDNAAKKALAQCALTLFELTMSSATLTKGSVGLVVQLMTMAGKAASGKEEKMQLRNAALHLSRLSTSRGSEYGQLSQKIRPLLPAK